MALFFIVVLLLTMGMEAKAGDQWRKVGSNGFGDSKNDYAWGMASFNGYLYVSTLNILTGSEIWRSRTGEHGTWERVYKSYFFSNTGIRCLYADGDEALYAGTLNKTGAEILRTVNGTAWTKVAKRGFGNWQNDTIRCIIRFGDHLYAGTGHDGAELYRSEDGFNWEFVDAKPGFSTMVLDPVTNNLVENNVMIGELTVFKNQIYAFTWTTDIGVLGKRFNFNFFDFFINFGSIINRYEGYEATLPEFFARTPGAFEVFRSENGVDWEKVVGLDDEYGNGLGLSGYDSENMANDVTTSVTVFDGHLYLGPENPNGRTSLWRTSNGTQWEKVLDFWELGEVFNFYIWRMIPYNKKLYIGTYNNGAVQMPGVTGAQIWVSETGNAGTFYQNVANGFDGGSTWFSNLQIPKNYGIRSFAIHNEKLYAGTATIISIPVPRLQGQQIGLSIAGSEVGCEVWQLVPGRFEWEEIMSSKKKSENLIEDVLIGNGNTTEHSAYDP